jgi:hypothetical protein
MNFNQAFEAQSRFSKKQAGVLFANYKQGKLHMTESNIKLMYQTVKEFEFNTGNRELRIELGCAYNLILQAIIDNNMELANELVVAHL